ncbi:MAG: hypothetical protein AABZ47_15030 [Planctomycetota bacterium]
MSDVAMLVLLYLAATLVLTAELFIPSHGVLTVVGLGFLVAAIAKTFSVGGHTGGTLAIVAVLVAAPVVIMISVKVWPRTPMGRRIAPPNPRATEADSGIPIQELRALVGITGRCVSSLRPVGICEISGRRVSCISQLGMIDQGSTVEVVGVTGGNLEVVEKKST